MDQPERQSPQLPPADHLAGFDFMSTRWDAKIPQGVQTNDILDPAFWAHHGVKLKPMDEIRARAEDGSWIAYLLVLDCSRTWAKVKLLAMHPLTTQDVSLTQASEADVKAFVALHTVKHRGPHKWSIVRNGDKAVIEEGIEQREDAAAKLEALARKQVGAPPAVQRPAAVTA